MENYLSPTVLAVPSDIFNKKSIILMQTTQLIKMICAISNYPTNTMQTSRKFLQGPAAQNGSSLGPGQGGVAQHLWDDR